jgi:hypothetical protein
MPKELITSVEEESKYFSVDEVLFLFEKHHISIHGMLSGDSTEQIKNNIMYRIQQAKNNSTYGEIVVLTSDYLDGIRIFYDPREKEFTLVTRNGLNNPENKKICNIFSQKKLVV